MDMQTHAYFLEALKGSIKPSTGCTEPGAIALNAATARAQLPGQILHLTLRVDEFLYKNAMGVGLPGTAGRGVCLCAALGLTAGDAAAGMNVLHGVTREKVAEAEALLAAGQITTEVLHECDSLYVQSILQTDQGTVRVTTTDRHDHIAEICFSPFDALDNPLEPCTDSPMLAYTIADMLAFVDAASGEELAFLQDGVDMNLSVAQAGEAMALGRAMRALMERGILGDSPITQAKVLCASASYARMCGVSLPVMTATGSGNQGITVTMTIEGAARALHTPAEMKLRGLALAHLINMYGKAHIGNLSAMCACGVSSGLGASVAIVYMMGGTPQQMLLAAQNMAGSICGMICDGAKEGCANKVELAGGLAVESALLAMEDVGIPACNGILDGEWKGLFANMGALSRDGMRETNHVIVKIMQRE